MDAVAAEEAFLQEEDVVDSLQEEAVVVVDEAEVALVEAVEEEDGACLHEGYHC